ncbi:MULTISPECIES: GntR family transcriptional regulator [Vibrio]|jgi:DNA-binding GntR family transcriptional regulator|uniref:GntR family transcriptional regulator n=2 Tax=Vibrio TaxID=662 RepID=A0A2G4B6K5_VIBSP|nr:MULTISPECIES: GntR family transcriptional regulator [Vibrio]KPL96663.1 GntR family transcriptional regulator [Vibrio splendidus]MBB1462604.1 GntR family transcriptional regulator [Vibrio sp. SG41-7]MBE8576050.1 GntR family transcriptional regulator [Vibrio sp. OPT18]MCC4786128.1 GntR family transcriptional regulator [Vibrio splendidus]MCQ8866958.1 GntR family transcriptional regulator [Vibrio splendidus]
MSAYQPLLTLIQERIEQKDKSPLYLKIADSVKLATEQQMLKGGDFIPTEREFSDKLGVSRITVRKALDILDKEGVIVRSRGLGTMISETVEYSSKEATGFSQQVVLKGKKPDTLWIKKDVIACSSEIAKMLKIAENDQVFLLKRVRYIDEQAVSIEESYVPAHLIHDPDEIQLSLYDYFRSQDISPTKTQSRVSAKMPTEEFLEKLNIDETVPVLLIEQTAYDKKGVPIEYSINRCRGDMYVFVSED